MLCCLAALAAALVGFPQVEAREPATKTNLVIIYADDLGYGDLSCYGHPQFQTPRLDQMAREGARLTSFYTSCPYCAPSRASLLTGRYPFRNGMTRNPAPDAGINDAGIAAEEITLAELLRDAGYRTACIGKWHLGHQPQFYPTRHGFQEFLGILYSNDMRPVELMQNETRLEYPVDQRTLTRRYTQRALEFIDDCGEAPFFLYLPHAMPHKPLAASDQFYRQSGAGLYGDVIAELDHGVGQVLDRIRERGLEQRTLVIFTSDNGPWYGGSSGPLRGMKGQNWEGGLRVPLIARWPGVIPPGHVSDEPAIIMDVFVTAARAAQLDPPQDRLLDGRDLLPLLTSNAASPHEALFSMLGDRLLTVRAGPWKLHPRGTPPPDRRPADWVDPRAPDGSTILAQTEQYSPRAFPGLQTGDDSQAAALFHLLDDPGEQHYLAGAQPEVVRRLSAIFERLEQEAQAR
jgi:arylsulfatase A-like enzyme